MNRYKHRLNEFLALSPGWLDGDGVAFSKEGIKWLENLLETYPQELPQFYVYPVPNGDVQLEWPLSPHDVELVINITSHHAEWYDLDLETNEYITKELSLTNDWPWVLSAIEHLSN
jgi:hypothetical protein